jgi:hypothetical protein
MQHSPEPGYGQGNDMQIHRTRGDGAAFCGGEVCTAGDHDSARDLIAHHGYRTCMGCSVLMTKEP